jgi:hypothetical protein
MTSCCRHSGIRFLSCEDLGNWMSTLSQKWAGVSLPRVPLVITNNRRPCHVLINLWTSCCQEILTASLINATGATSALFLCYLYLLPNHKWARRRPSCSVKCDGKSRHAFRNMTRWPTAVTLNPRATAKFYSTNASAKPGAFLYREDRYNQLLRKAGTQLQSCMASYATRLISIPLCEPQTSYLHICIYTVDPRKSNGLILEQLETRTKNLRKIQFETRIKIRKSNHDRGIAQHRAAHSI